MRDALTDEELRIVAALRACPESTLSCDYPAELPLSLREIGALMGMSYENVRRIEGAALKKLRRAIAREAIKCEMKRTYGK